MSRIPDCRTDEYYNERYLGGDDRSFVHGFDWCVERAVDNFFDNLDFGLLGPDSHLLHMLSEELPEKMRDSYEWESFYEGQKETREVRTYADYLRSLALEWIEHQRDEVITSMIDEMDEATYAANKAAADAAGAGADNK